MKAAVENLTHFIVSERDRFGDRDGDVFAFAFSRISRDCRFLDIILGRYDAASKAYIENTKWPTSLVGQAHTDPDEQRRLYVASVDTMTMLHLEIESFYLFAKILLDHLAHAIEYYFGQARCLSLDSHDNLAKSLLAYTESKGLSTPDDHLKGIIHSLKADISDYRDYEIAHEKSPRSIKATMFTWSEPPEARIVRTRAYPSEKDVQIESKSLHHLAELLDNYIRAIVAWIAKNRDRCCLTGAKRV